MDDIGEYLLSQSNQTFYGELMETQAASYIYIYVSPWLLFFGTLGNLVSSYIMHKMSNRVWSTCLYMEVIPIVDLLILYVECGNTWIQYLTKGGLNISNIIMITTNAICKVYIFLFNFVLHLSPWLVVAMIGESVVSFKCTRMTPRLCTREHTRAVILLISVLLICVNIQFFWTHGLMLPPVDSPSYIMPFCTYNQEWSESWSDSFREMIWPSINYAIGHLLPLITIFILCFIISIGQVRLVLDGDYRRRQQLRNNAMFQHFLDPVAFQEFQGTILAVGFAYLITMPPQTCLILYQFLVYRYYVTTYTPKLDAQLKLATAITHMLAYSFLSFKFGIFYMSSRRFQREFSLLLQKLCNLFKCPKKHRHSVRNASPVKRKPWQEDEQMARLVTDDKNHVSPAMDNHIVGHNSPRCQLRITTDV